MEGGRGPEFEIEQPEITESGFSEKRAARILEGKQMDDSQVKKRKLVVLSPKQKIINRAARLELTQREKLLTAYEKNTQEIHALLRSLSTLAQGAFRQTEQIIAEVRQRQKTHDELLHALIMDTKGELAEDTLSKELQDLIK